MHRLIEQRERAGTLVPVTVEGAGRSVYWSPEAIESSSQAVSRQDARLVHLLSPFDPLVIYHRRLAQFFGHEHCFEAYVPKAK